MCLLLVVTMVMQLASVSFAAISTTTIGAVSYTYNAETKTYTASVSARGLENDAMLIIAEYDASGNVKASGISRTAANAKDGFLKASVTVTDEANEVKAFVWDKNHAPFNLDTALSKEYSAEDIEIYFDGVPFAEAIGEELELDSKYDFALPVQEGDFRLPRITFDFNGNTIDADVKTDGEALKTVITFEAGERTATPSTITNKNNETTVFKATRYEYSKPWVHTVTINYVLPEAEGYITKDMTAKRTGGVNGLYGAGNDAQYDYVMEYKLPEGAEYGEISFKADSFANQYTIIIAEPLEAATKGTDAIVKADGSPVTWVDEKGTFAAYEYTLSGDDRINEPWDQSRVTYAQMSSDTSVVLKGATSDNGTQVTFKTCTPSDGSGHYRVMRRLQESDGYFVTGAKIAEGYRDPSSQKVQYTQVPDHLLGYNYITNYGAEQYDMTVSMTVNQDVKLHFISTANNNGVKKVNADDTETPVSATTLATADRFKREYLNTMEFDGFSAAYAVKYMGMDESIFFRTGDYTFTYPDKYAGKTYKYTTDAYVVRNWAQARRISADTTFNYGMYLLPQYVESTGIGAVVSGTTATVNKKSIAEYVAMFKEIKGTEPLVSTPVINTNLIYNGSKVTYAAGLQPVIREFNGASTNKSIFSDRAGVAQQRHTGMIVSYPEAFDLEDSTFITTAVKYGDGGEDDKTMYRLYGNIDKLADYKHQPLYSFTVARDAEVLIFSTGANAGFYHGYLEKPENGWTVSTVSEPITYVHLSNEVALDAKESVSCPVLNRVYRKVFNAGDTVTIYTPGNTDCVFVPFIKEINLPHTADAANITIDGTALEGFDKDVMTYTYSFNDIARATLPVVAATAVDPTSNVEITYNKSFEAPSAKVTITDANGKEKVYTINFVNTGVAEVTNLYLCTEGNIIPKEYLGETATGDANATNLPKYIKNGFGKDMTIWTDRTNYKVTVVNDESLVGLDVIKTCVAWWNESNPENTVWSKASNGVYVSWVNFKTTRAAKVMVFKTTNNNATAYQSCGFTHATNDYGYFKIVRDGGNVNSSTNMYWKDVDAGELVSVPNDTEAYNSYTILIKYADYK